MYTCILDLMHTTEAQTQKNCETELISPNRNTIFQSSFVVEVNTTGKTICLFREFFFKCSTNKRERKRKSASPLMPEVNDLPQEPFRREQHPIELCLSGHYTPRMMLEGFPLLARSVILEGGQRGTSKPYCKTRITSPFILKLV